MDEENGITLPRSRMCVGAARVHAPEEAFLGIDGLAEYTCELVRPDFLGVSHKASSCLRSCPCLTVCTSQVTRVLHLGQKFYWMTKSTSPVARIE